MIKTQVHDRVVEAIKQLPTEARAAEPTITCPSCKTEIKLTESLAAPLVEAKRQEFETRLAQQGAEIAKREGALRSREEALAQQQQALEAQVAEKVAEQRGKIAAEEAKKAKAALAIDLAQKEQENAELQETLKLRDVKLAEARKAEAELRRKQRDLEEGQRELELTVEKRVQEGLDATRLKARKEAEERLGLKLRESEETISSMQQKIEELKRKAEQGSQQLQGEVQELELEDLLGGQFPKDEFVPVPKGEHGGDLLQRVTGPGGAACGTILWESKRTKAWSDGWLAKLRNDQRDAKAEVAVIVSQVLPKGVETLGCVGNVWVTRPGTALVLATLLRQKLIEVAAVQKASEGQQTKMEEVYAYLTSSQFRRRVDAILEPFNSMQADLNKEKKAITKQWAKRETQINRVIAAAGGMVGDLQGIAGKSLKELDGFDLKALGSGKDG